MRVFRAVNIVAFSSLTLMGCESIPKAGSLTNQIGESVSAITGSLNESLSSLNPFSNPSKELRAFVVENDLYAAFRLIEENTEYFRKEVVKTPQLESEIQLVLDDYFRKKFLPEIRICNASLTNLIHDSEIPSERELQEVQTSHSKCTNLIDEFYSISVMQEFSGSNRESAIGGVKIALSKAGQRS